MGLAVDLARKSEQESRGDRRMSPNVGAVIVKDGTELATGFRGEAGDGAHAEFSAIEKLKGKYGDEGAAQRLAGATLYTTLEPCTQRKTKTPCVEHILAAKLGKVYIGTYDPNPVVYRLGWKRLRDAGVGLRDFTADFRQQIETMNKSFIDQFRCGKGDSGIAVFDYKQNGGAFDVEASSGTFQTKWGGSTETAMHAYGPTGHVALARYATEFSEIDDPGAYPNPDYVISQSLGDISVFPAEHGWLLVRVGAIVGPNGDGPTAVTISWQARRLDGSLPTPEAD